MTTHAHHRQVYRYYDLILGAFVTVLSVLQPDRPGQMQSRPVGTLTFGAGVLFFPISYIFGDILTEVYGYARARQGDLVPASAHWSSPRSWPPWWWRCRPRRLALQPAYEALFGTTWRIAAASLSAYFCGEFVNSYTLAKMKLLDRGASWLWTRTIGSTIFGEAVDSRCSTRSRSSARGIIQASCRGDDGALT